MEGKAKGQLTITSEECELLLHGSILKYKMNHQALQNSILLMVINDQRPGPSLSNRFTLQYLNIRDQTGIL